MAKDTAPIIVVTGCKTAITNTSINDTASINKPPSIGRPVSIHSPVPLFEPYYRLRASVWRKVSRRMSTLVLLSPRSIQTMVRRRDLLLGECRWTIVIVQLERRGKKVSQVKQRVVLYWSYNSKTIVGLARGIFIIDFSYSASHQDKSNHPCRLLCLIIIPYLNSQTRNNVTRC